MDRNSSPNKSIPMHHRPKYSVSHHENKVFTKTAAADDSTYSDHHHHSHHLRASSLHRQNNTTTRLIIISIITIVLLGLSYFRISSTSSPTKCKLSFGSYGGNVYHLDGSTAENECLIESRWMRVARHKVIPFASSPSSSVISDWLYIDYHDRINVLVQLPNNDNDNDNDTITTTGPPEFLVFEQTKYSLGHLNSLAVVGGIIEPGESPDIAAAREVNEETGRTCHEMIPLGRFRTDVNRGMGWVHGYLGIDCAKTDINDHNNNNNNNNPNEKVMEEVGEPDTERQHARILTLEELKDAARKGQFLEVQWSNTVALALLHPRLQQQQQQQQ